MGIYKKILVCLDLTTDSEQIVERALVLARQSGGSTEQLWRRICRSEGLSLLLLRRPQEQAGVESLDAEALLATLAGRSVAGAALSPDAGPPAP